MHRDVAHLHLVLVLAGALHAVVNHDVTEGAGGGYPGRTGGDELTGARIVDLGPDRLFHPHAGAAGATAHPLRAVPLGFHDLDAPERADHLARGQVHVVVATEVARVVVHDTLLEPRL